jgi:ABC-type transport system involved in cytochrome c biogenesis permease subunit
MLEFVSRISVVCFVASYAVALACEASRLLFRSGVRGAVMVGFAAAGLVAHTAFLLWRAASEAAVPLSSPFDWYLLAAWVLAAGSLALTLANPRIPIGLFTLPVVLALIGAATLSSRAAFPQSPATQVWGVIHGSFNLAASLAVAAGAIAAVMWLFQAGRLARKEPPKRGFRMPSLERLSHTTMHAMTVAAWTAAAGFTSGLILNAVNKQRGLLETVPWTDPVVLRMAMLVSWLMVAAVIARTVKQRPGGARMIVWLSLVSFFVLTGSIVWGLFGATRHGMPPTPPSAISEVTS